MFNIQNTEPELGISLKKSSSSYCGNGSLTFGGLTFAFPRHSIFFFFDSVFIAAFFTFPTEARGGRPWHEERGNGTGLICLCTLSSTWYTESSNWCTLSSNCCPESSNSCPESENCCSESSTWCPVSSWPQTESLNWCQQTLVSH